jgi:RNA 3'-terminal phosphate cyclase (ATP)
VETVEIDGSFGEGGGQVLRSSLALSALTGQPVHLRRVRAGRREPGLAPQHLLTVLALAEVCDAELQGASLRSQEVWFAPHRRPQPGEYVFDVTEAARGGSAGAASLVLQTVMLPLSLAEGASRVTVRGGTHVPWSPSFDYLAHVYLPAIRPMGVVADLSISAWGFYPVGGGQLHADIEGAAGRALLPLRLTERGTIKRVWGQAIACSLPSHIPQRMVNRAANVLAAGGLPSQLTPRRERCAGPGAGIMLIAEYEHACAGFAAIGAKGKPSEEVADEACAALLVHHDLGAPVDLHLADQILLPLALADGPSEYRTSRITGHLLTNAHVIRQFVHAEIEVAGQEGRPGTVSVRGAGWDALRD